MLSQSYVAGGGQCDLTSTRTAQAAAECPLALLHL